MADIRTMDPFEGRFLISEANDWRSRDEAVVDASGGALKSGTVLGQVTATGKYVAHAPGAADGSEGAAAILLLSTEEEEAKYTIIARDAEVNGDKLVYADGISDGDKDSANAALADAGIVVRTKGA